MLRIIGFSVFILASCTQKTGSEIASENSGNKATLPASERKDYRQVAEDLYQDANGAIYHRTIDVSAADGNRHPERGVYAYRSGIFIDTIINGEKTQIIASIRERVDLPTFRRMPDKEELPRHTFYEDENYRYYVIEVADGGTLCASRKQ